MQAAPHACFAGQYNPWLALYFSKFREDQFTGTDLEIMVCEIFSTRARYFPVISCRAITAR